MSISFLGVDIPIKTGGLSISVNKKDAPVRDMNARSNQNNGLYKRAITAKLKTLSAEKTDFFRCVFGGNCMSIDSSVGRCSSDGVMPSSGSVSVDYAPNLSVNGKSHRLKVTTSAIWPTNWSQDWTVAMFEDKVGNGVFSHTTVKSDGKKLSNGIRNDSMLTGNIVHSVNGLSLSGNYFYDNIMVFNCLVPDEFILAMYSYMVSNPLEEIMFPFIKVNGAEVGMSTYYSVKDTSERHVFADGLSTKSVTAVMDEASFNDEAFQPKPSMFLDLTYDGSVNGVLSAYPHSKYMLFPTFSPSAFSGLKKYTTLNGTTYTMSSAGQGIYTANQTELMSTSIAGSQISVSATVLTSTTTGTIRTIMGVSGSGGSKLLLRINAIGAIEFLVKATPTSAQQTIATSNVVVGGEWSHIVATADFATGKAAVFINGTGVLFTTVATDVGITSDVGAYVDVGTSNLADYFIGSIAHVAIYQEYIDSRGASALFFNDLRGF